MNQKYKNLKNITINLNHTVEQVIHKLNKVGQKIVLVVDDNNSLLGTVSDGDIRRGLLKGVRLENSIKIIANFNPVFIQNEITDFEILEIMKIKKVQQIPIVDKNKKVIGIKSWDELNNHEKYENTMVIMAGGQGIRLRPHTEFLPKPMVKIAGKPMLEHIILKAKNEGITNFIISVNYLSNIIIDYFSTGKKFGVKINYIKEKKPLGTIGALSLLKMKSENPIIVTNGDVITNLNYSEFLAYHVKYKSTLTVAIRKFEYQIPYGTVELKNFGISDYQEKPVITRNINGGIYVINSFAINYLKRNERCDFPEFFNILQNKKERIRAYPIHEDWIDVGSPRDLEMINILMKNDNELKLNKLKTK